MIQFSIQFDLAALALLLVVLVHFYVKRRIVAMQARFFTVCLAFALISVVFDIISVYTIQNSSTVPLWLNYLINTVYLASQLIVPLLLVIYLLVAVRSYAVKDVKMYMLVGAPALLAVIALCVLNPSTHWCFFFDEAGVYTYGPLHVLIYANAIIYIVLILIATFVLRKKMTKVQFGTVVLVDLIIPLGLVMQYFYPSYLLVGLCFAYAILMVYLSFQNPYEDSDALTGLPSRQSFYYRASQMLKKHPAETFVIAYFNIRHFKAINDLLGMKRGDELLVYMGTLLEKYCKGVGVCARFEGDHFAICVPEHKFSLVRLLELSDSSALRSLVPLETVISFGIYATSDRSLPINLMCDRALMALKRADADSKTRFAFYDNALRNKVVDEYEMAAEVEAALRDGQFMLLYQPIYDLRTEQIVSAEVLLRWKHPSKGLILPESFMPLLKNKGLVSEADRFVWRTVCGEMQRYREQLAIDLPLSINLSNVHLYNSKTAGAIQEVLAEHGLDAAHLRLELAESTYMEDKAIFKEAVQEFRDQGFSVIVDDFGGGYSSLGVFKETAFNQLKIDMQFMKTLDGQGRGELVLEAIADMAHDMGFFVIAEGVETARQLAFLREVGCDAAQGFYFSEPIDARRFERLLCDGAVSEGGRNRDAR